MNELSQSQGAQSGLPSESDLDGQAGLATYVAAIFNAVAYPPNLPAIKIEALEREAAPIRAQPSHIAFAPDGAKDPEAIRAREREAEDRADVQIGLIMQNQQWEQQRQREEWARTSSSVGGIALTGREWDELAKRLRSDDDLRSRITSAFLARGMSENEAEARYERAAEVAEIMAIPSSQRTAEQNATVKAADADPTFKQDMRDTADARAGKAPVAASALTKDFTVAANAAATPKIALTPAPLVPTPAITIVDGPGL